MCKLLRITSAIKTISRICVEVAKMTYFFITKHFKSAMNYILLKRYLCLKVQCVSYRIARADFYILLSKTGKRKFCPIGIRDEGVGLVGMIYSLPFGQDYRNLS